MIYAKIENFDDGDVRITLYGAIKEMESLVKAKECPLYLSVLTEQNGVVYSKVFTKDQIGYPILVDFAEAGFIPLSETFFYRETPDEKPLN